MIQIRRLASSDPHFQEKLEALLSFEVSLDDEIDRTVVRILNQVKQRGDEALLELTRKFDNPDVTRIDQIELSRDQLQAALESLNASQREALEQAAERIRAYHEKQLAQSWDYVEPDGTRLGQKITPLDRVGLYVPGGKAAYPSSVLMNAIPARVAGVNELIMVTPTPGGEKNPLVLAAAAICEVDRVFAIGGA
ncbi:histidinol dehydrogenase, partial [Nitrosomonas sp.]|uniref:histidinol dehydrogenase n=1 Tax=Nitrosomonas sp. TaxID=42353 RepID=UPI0025E1435C